MSAGAEGAPLIDPDARVAADARIGAGTVVATGACVEAGSLVGAGCRIEQGAVLGKAPRLAAHSSARGDDPGPLVLGDGVTVCCNAVLLAGARIGAGAIVGDQAFVRERAVVGEATVVGRGSAVDNDVSIGARVRIQTLVYVTAGSVVEDDVFIGPGAVTTNDDTMARHDPAQALRGVTLRRACRIGGGAVLVPGIEVGEEAFVAAGAVVVRDVPPRAVVMGTPARHVRDVGDEDLLERWR